MTRRVSGTMILLLLLVTFRRISTQGCTIQDNYLIPAGNNAPGGQGISSNGPDDCNDKCVRNNQCVAWTLQKETNLCWLKTVTNFIGDRNGWISGTKCDGGCQQRRVRKNVNSLTSEEVINLQNAMKRALESSVPWRRYQDVAHFHWSPNTGSDALTGSNALCGEGVGCCPHGSEEFLPWHRLLMANMEELLGEPLPYWDWTVDRDVPNIFDDITVPFKNTQSDGTQCQGTNTRSIRRGTNINIPSTDLKRGVHTAFTADTFDTFSSSIEEPHNQLHVSMNCDMRSLLTAGYDPIFYLHHTNVDRQFAFWQELQRIQNRDIEHPDLSIPLQPFNRDTYNKFEKTRNNNLGVDTLDYKTNLCYEYDTLTFDGMTPEEFNTRRAQTIFRHFVGIVLPKLGPSTAVKFSVCRRRGRCKAAGSVFTFGLGGRAGREHKKTVNSMNYYIAEKEVTQLDLKNWNKAYARVTSSLNISPVAPVIIRRTIQDHLRGGVVIYAPGTNSSMYGDLLEKFTDSVKPIKGL